MAPAATDARAPIETSDPSVVSRRTAGIDVLVLPDGVELPEGTWDYSVVPPVVPLRKVGPSD